VRKRKKIMANNATLTDYLMILQRKDNA